MTYRLATIYVCIWPSSFSPVRISPIGLPQHKHRNLNKLTLTKRMLYKKRNSQEMTFSDYNGCNYFTIKSKAQFFLTPFFSRSVGSTFEANTRIRKRSLIQPLKFTAKQVVNSTSWAHYFMPPQQFQRLCLRWSVVRGLSLDAAPGSDRISIYGYLYIYLSPSLSQIQIWIYHLQRVFSAHYYSASVCDRSSRAATAYSIICTKVNGDDTPQQ